MMNERSGGFVAFVPVTLICEIRRSDFDQNNKSQNHSRIEQEYTDAVGVEERNCEAGRDKDPIQE